MTRFNPASEILLEFDSSLRTQSWQASRTHYSTARWRAYINRLCFYGALPWLADLGFDPDQAYSVEQSHWAIWGLVGGTAVPLEDGTRLVLLPSEAADTDELRIPQEWVDSPRWAADYYIGVRLDPEVGQCLWGYATHAQIKQQGSYDSGDRTYSLAEGTVGDLTALSLIRALCSQEPTRLDIPALPKVPPAQATSLLERLAHASSPALRLAVPFALWGALLEDEAWRSRLWELRSGAARPEPATVPADVGAARVEPVCLREWLRRLEQSSASGLEQGWQPLDALLPANSLVSMAFRDLESSQTATGGKRITFDKGVVGVLVVGAVKEADGRVGVRVQLRPEAGAGLPQGVVLSLLSPSGEVVQTVQNRAIDDYIQLKRFRLPPGYPFIIQVQLGVQTVLEQFTT
ncbi:MAG: DUF1822 family protein [Cyanobacteria bacterium P01_A01_bin.135]